MTTKRKSRITKTKTKKRRKAAAKPTPKVSIVEEPTISAGADDPIEEDDSAEEPEEDVYGD